MIVLLADWRGGATSTKLGEKSYNNWEGHERHTNIAHTHNLGFYK